MGRGTRVWAFTHVLHGAVIGRDCNICDGAYVEGGARIGDRVTVKNQVLVFDGVIIEDDVFLGPGVVFTNDLRPRAHIKRTGASLLGTTVRRGVTLGAGVIVVCGTTIGRDAFVGAGAVIVDDVPAHAFIVGNPARAALAGCARVVGGFCERDTDVNVNADSKMIRGLGSWELSEVDQSV